MSRPVHQPGDSVLHQQELGAREEEELHRREAGVPGHLVALDLPDRARQREEAAGEAEAVVGDLPLREADFTKVFPVEQMSVVFHCAYSFSLRENASRYLS